MHPPDDMLAGAEEILVELLAGSQAGVDDVDVPAGLQHWLDADTPEQAVRAVVHLVARHLPRSQGYDPIRDIQVLCPMNRGGVGARSLNIELQAALNPAGEIKVQRFGWTFAPGDKVMQIENDY